MNIQIPDGVDCYVALHVNTPEQYDAILAQFPDVTWVHQRWGEFYEVHGVVGNMLIMLYPRCAV